MLGHIGGGGNVEVDKTLKFGKYRVLGNKFTRSQEIRRGTRTVH